MMYRSMILMILSAFCFMSCTEEKDSGAEDISGAMDLYLLIGQSNMAGRGEIAAQDTVAHPRIFSLSREGEWVPAVDPLHFDKPVAGVGLGRSFALSLAEIDENVTIGLIPAAAGGSPISSWEPDGYHGQTESHPYDDAIRRAKRAMQDGTLKGILWHQGESDCKPELAEVYEEKLIALIERIRGELDAYEVPFIVGQMARCPETPWDDVTTEVDEIHQRVAQRMSLSGFVFSEGLTCKSDNVHFDARSLRILGQRYAETFLGINK